jgi:hypothetical protein
MKYEASQNLSATEFKRLFGVRRETFAQMTELRKHLRMQGRTKTGINTDEV